ncbi:MAG: Rrf2 family transcriptional regulator [Alphaproteobacteria bacterium]|nr:Rrf2 family transcriptional regulator [Alphaproteobacteria bacterium]
MRLTTRARYAVLAMLDLAAHARERPVSLGDVAARQEISQAYLEQLFCKLRRSGMVCSVRGARGGYRLARDAAETSIAEIVLAVEEPILDPVFLAELPSGCREQPQGCPAEALWNALGRQIAVFLRGVTLADVVERRIGDPPAFILPLAAPAVLER